MVDVEASAFVLRWAITGYFYRHVYFNYTSIKNNCLKLKNEVGMAVLKSKQTRVVYRDDQHIRRVHPYACFSRLIRLLPLLLFTNTAKVVATQKQA